MKSIDFRTQLGLIENRVIETVKETLKKFEDFSIDFVDYEINCPCINPGAAEHDLHTVAGVYFYENGNSLHFRIDDQQCGYTLEQIPLEALIDVLDQIEDIEL